MRSDGPRPDERELVDAALRRLFEPPAHVPLPDGVPRPPRPAAHAGPLGGGAWGWRVALALAAGLAGFLLLVRDGDGDGPPPEPIATAAPRPAGGLRPVPGSGPGPDLDQLYADAVQNRGMAMCSAPDELDAVWAALTESCGADFYVRPEAAGILQGPFGSAEWPTGTVLTGYPEGPEGQASVLVAECEASEVCCLDTRLAEGGPLHLFSSRFGDIVLTEITPLDEPRLLQYFGVR